MIGPCEHEYQHDNDRRNSEDHRKEKRISPSELINNYRYQHWKRTLLSNCSFVHFIQMIILQIISEKSGWKAEILRKKNSTSSTKMGVCENITLICLMISRGPIRLALYLICPRWVRRATLTDIIPVCFCMYLSILSTHDAHVIPSIWKKIDESDLYRND